MLPLIEYIKHPEELLTSLLRDFGGWIPDKQYLQILYYLKMGKRLNLKDPQTFSEKLQWLKLYNRKPEYIQMVDKYAVKDYVARIVGKKYVIPTIGVWDKLHDIDFDNLPNQFVLKTTHGGGSDGVIICRDKDKICKDVIIKNLRKSWNSNIYKAYREWPYKNVPRRIIAEQYIGSTEDPIVDLTDYKFYCFNGTPKYCQVIKNRHSEETIDFFDMEWNHQCFYGLNPVCGIGQEIRPAKERPERPMHYDIMKELARQLSKGFAFSRIDLYDTPQGPLFGEFTLYPASGIGTFTPSQYNIVLGNMIILPHS